uniref:FHA domain-containing protein n=1 Tax=Schistocephalus solidus TaxID=70667 RepID=A0A0X3PX69_SCHSO
MSSVTLMWVGDLNQDRKMQGLSTKVSDEKFRPKIIELKEGQKEIRIGRLNSTNPPHYTIESCINKRMISRNHATIERLLNGGFMLYDHSMNGTYINYMRVSGGVPLKHGDIVCFGHLNGANLKPGEDVAPFFSDLKYQVYLGNPNQTKDSSCPDSTPVGKRQRQTSQSGSLGSPKGGDTGSPETKMSRSTTKKTTNSHKSRRLEAQDRKAENDDEEEAGDKSNNSSSEDDLLTAASKRKPPTSNITSSIKQKKSNGERQTKRHSVASSSPPPSTHSKKSSSLSKPSSGSGGHQHHGTKERKSGRSTGTSSSAAKRAKTENDAELDSGGELYHYDTEECSARPCKHPQDVSIDWIQCDKCSNWYHQVCLGLRASEANVDVYYCPYCKKN